MRRAELTHNDRAAYAQGWARNIKAAEAVKRIRTDPHSPTNYRGVLALFVSRRESS